MAPANIALAKYWGKRPGPENFPAVPSLSITLSEMSTKTRVVLERDAPQDSLFLNGVHEEGHALARVSRFLGELRAECGGGPCARVESINDFPTASGLASSASGFAALALAASCAYGLSLDPEAVSDRARRGSISAARSIFPGFVELPAGPPAPTARDKLSAKSIAAPQHADLALLVCVVSEAKKAVSSTDGMRLTSSRSPYYAAWLAEAPRLFQKAKAALLECDVGTLGELTEASALAMHASAMGAGVLYFRPVTLLLFERVRAMRSEGIPAYATADAGPHVKVLVPRRIEHEAARVLAETPGVLRVLQTHPGDGARIETLR